MVPSPWVLSSFSFFHDILHVRCYNPLHEHPSDMLMIHPACRGWHCDAAVRSCPPALQWKRKTSAVNGAQERKSAVMTLLPPVPGAASTAATRVAGAPILGGVTLVTGGTGGVGRRVVQLLLEQGARVRAIVRDLPRARALVCSLPLPLPGRGGEP